MATEIHGYCDERFLPVKEAFAANFAEGLEVGASLAATLRGETVVDLWSGHSDWAKSRPWQEDTIVKVFSTTKIATILCVLLLVDRGLLDLDERVSAYWPEFAAGGKDHVTIREALTHRAGTPGFDPPVTAEELRDWDAMAANIAAQPHWFGGESVFCYHPTTYGFLLGEIIRRVTGKLASQVFREEIAEKAGIDFQIGLRSRADLGRLAEMGYLTPPGVVISGHPLYSRVFASIVGELKPNSWEARALESPSGNGYGNGRSIARLCAICAQGGVLDGDRYLSKAILDEASREQVHARDDYLGEIRLGLGFGLDSEFFPAPTPTSFHWGGYGGSFGTMDPMTGVSCGYAMNNLIVGDDSISTARMARLFKGLRASIERL